MRKINLKHLAAVAVFLLMLTRLSPAQAQSFVQACGSSTSSSISCTITNTGDTVAIVAGCSGFDCTINAAPTSTPSYTWHLAKDSSCGSSVDNSVVYYATGVASGPLTISYTSTRENAYELSNASTLDQTAAGCTTSAQTPVTGTTGTTSTASEIAVGVIRGTTPGSLAAIGGTLGTWTNTTEGGTNAAGYAVLSSTGTAGAQGTNASVTGGGVVVTFSGSAGPTPTPTATPTGTPTATNTSTGTPSVTPVPCLKSGCGSHFGYNSGSGYRMGSCFGY